MDSVHSEDFSYLLYNQPGILLCNFTTNRQRVRCPSRGFRQVWIVFSPRPINSLSDIFKLYEIENRVLINCQAFYYRVCVARSWLRGWGWGGRFKFGIVRVFEAPWAHGMSLEGAADFVDSWGDFVAFFLGAAQHLEFGVQVIDLV